jgi:hypothetical protein
MIPNRPPICFNVSHRKQRKNMGKKIRIPKYFPNLAKNMDLQIEEF